MVWRDAIDGKLCNSTRGKSAHGARSGDGIAGDGEIGKKPSLEGTDHLHPPGIFHCMYTCGSAQIRGVMGSAPGRSILEKVLIESPKTEKFFVFWPWVSAS
ncbi:MAG: hypothetical protein ACLR1T_13840 [Evtepia gabavorous]